MLESNHGFAVKIYAREEFSPPKLGFLTKNFSSRLTGPASKSASAPLFMAGVMTITIHMYSLLLLRLGLDSLHKPSRNQAFRPVWGGTIKVRTSHSLSLFAGFGPLDTNPA
jgi:hypothetical protein